ncbi:MAG: transposase [Bacteroidales bacterium]
MVLFRKFDPEKHHRQSIRLQAYDYSQPGSYFVTLCTYGREFLFGNIENGTMILNSFGQIARDALLKTPEIRQEIQLGEFVIMPNHVHGIVNIIEKTINHSTVGAYGHTPVGANCNSPQQSNRHSPPRSPSKTLGAVVRGYKSSVTTQINILRKTPKQPVWQRNYYDHIIRDYSSYEKISDYIRNNPASWSNDIFYI